MFESKSGILFIAGIGFFAFAFLSNALVPVLMYKDLPEKSAEEAVTAGALYHFEELQRRYPESFATYYGDEDSSASTDSPSAKSMEEKCAEALRLGRQVYIGEGCWHCHSQFVRPVSNESLRWGEVAATEEFQNELQRPVMFGTRRVGPDLSREGGRRSNDWHAVHFFEPNLVSAESPMPAYPWLFDGSPDKPNRRGLALITYVQWLGSWLNSYPYYEEWSDLENAEYALPADTQKIKANRP